MQRERCELYTQMAEAYPRPLSDILGAAAAIDGGYAPQRRKLDVAACARCVARCVGEALKPGPRRPVSRDVEVSLADVNLLEPGTIAIRARIWSNFVQWVLSHFGKHFWRAALTLPPLFSQLLVAFGYHCFESSVSLHYYRQLLAHVQREILGIRVFMSPAWEVCSKWELVEPIQHRPPLPEPILRAMSVIGLSWGWTRWTTALLFAFFAAARVGEVLKARRRHLLTPADLLSERKVAYLQIESPKSRRRGAKMQYVTVEEPLVIELIDSVWQQLEKDEPLFPLSPGAFRTRWNAVLKHLQVGTEHRLTPGSLRAGGAVFLHRSGVSISDLLWRMRLQHQKTLSYYLQEVTASSILPSLRAEVRENIQVLQSALPHFVFTRARPAAHNRA